MKQILLTLLFLVLFVSFPLFSQTNNAGSFSIKGQVIDSLANESVPYATLKIVSAAAPTQTVKLLACDDDGKFETTLNAPGSYIVFMQSVGKNPAQREFTLTENEKKKDLGQLFMVDDAQQLGEVTVSAQKPLVKVELDKISYSLEDDPEAKTNNTLEMLRKVPMVTVDGEDKIQLKGSTNFKIYMNGKPSTLLSNNPSDVLKSMPASSIKNIEVITEPGARYDAEGVGGIINIITNSNSLQGFSGNIRANANTAGFYGGSAYLTAKVGKVGLTGNYSYSQRNTPWNDSESVRENLLSESQRHLTQTGRSKNKGPFQYGYVEISYEIDTLNLLSIGGNLHQGKSRNLSELAVQMTDINNNPVYRYDRHSDSESIYGNRSVNVDYQRSTRKKDELITASYRFNDSPNDSESYTELRNIENYIAPLRYPQQNINDASTKEHTGQIDYTTPTRKGHTFEIGAKYINRQSRSETTRTMADSTGLGWVEIPSTNSHFKHTQHIYSGYAGYSIRWAKFGVKAGIRAEGTALKVDFMKEPEQNFDTDFFDFVPNATLSYQLGMSHQLRLGYNMRIYRPGIWHLNPYVNNTDPENIRFGNPNLDSEKSNSFNFNYSSFTQKFNLNASVSYSYVNNSIEQYTFIDPETPNVSQSTYGNIGKRQQVGGYLYASWTPNPKFNVYVNGGVNYIDMKTNKTSHDQSMSNSGVNGHVFTGARLSLPHDFRLNLNGGYFSPWIQLQGKGSAHYFIGLNANKDLLDKKMTITLGIQNPFWKTQKYTQTSSDATFNMRNVNHWTGRAVFVSVSYKFGSMKEQIKKVRRGINNDDQKGGGGNQGGGEGGGGTPQ